MRVALAARLRAAGRDVSPSAASTAYTARMRLAEVLGSLSLATDLTDGFRLEKAMRTAVLASAIARRMGIDESQRLSAYWSALVRFIGCTAFAAEESGTYSAGDDVALRSVLAKVDFGSMADFARRVLPNVGKEGSLPRRLSALARLLGNPDAPRLHAVAQCEVGSHLAAELELGEEVLSSLALREERYDGRGPRRAAAGTELPVAARIADVADVAELFFCEGGVALAAAHVRKRRGGQLDPAIADVFLRDSAELLQPLEAASIFELFVREEGAQPREIDAVQLRKVATAYAHVVDLRSRYTAGHSIGVAALVERACEVAGVAAEACELSIVAGLLHDVGNLAIPGGLLDKPGPLTRWERARVNEHASQTALVLGASPALARVAEIAAAAHEYGCGAGYPRATGHAPLALGARIVMAADVLHALREHRGHRPAFDRATAGAMLRDAAHEGRLCPAAVRAVLEADGQPTARKALPRQLSERETEVLRLVAIGRTNAEIGQLLGISARTAQKHVMNMYDKLGIGSRARAALFAAEHGLLD